MKKLGLIISIICAFSLFINAQTINSQVSKVNFTIGNMKWKTVEGTFSGMKGNINFDASDLKNSSFNVCIDAATINTESEKRDEHLRKEDFLFTEKYPTICFKSSTVTKTEDGFKTKGTISLLAVTKEVIVNFTSSNNAFVGKLEINRFDYNLGEATGTFMMGETINLNIICVLE